MQGASVAREWFSRSQASTRIKLLPGQVSPGCPQTTSLIDTGVWRRASTGSIKRGIVFEVLEGEGGAAAASGFGLGVVRDDEGGPDHLVLVVDGSALNEFDGGVVDDEFLACGGSERREVCGRRGRTVPVEDEVAIIKWLAPRFECEGVLEARAAAAVDAEAQALLFAFLGEEMADALPESIF